MALKLNNHLIVDSQSTPLLITAASPILSQLYYPLWLDLQHHALHLQYNDEMHPLQMAGNLVCHKEVGYLFRFQ